MRVVVCTFATPEYAGSAELLRHTALRAGQADEVTVYTPEDVADLYKEYPELLKGKDQRGYGWWSWKAWCISKTLRATDPGDVVVYCDAAMMVMESLRPLAEQTRDILLFRLGDWTTKDYRNSAWTKRDTFALMGRNTDAHKAGIQLTAAVQMYRHTPAALDFLETYKGYSSQKEVIDDARVLANYPEFQDHRHDQSILSILAVGHPGVQMARDPSQYGLGDPQLGVPCDTQIFDHHRTRRRPARVAVITPTTGGPHLKECLASVQAQDLPNVRHYVVVDGPQYEHAVRKVVGSMAVTNHVPTHVTVLPHNVGAGGWNGHRVYGSWPWLVDADYVAYLDDDNFWDTDHLRLLLRSVVNAKVPWAHCLRRIVTQDGTHVAPDNCESLGGICHTVCGRDDRLIDTNCYLITRKLAIETSECWNSKFRSGEPEADRQLARTLLSTAPHVCVRRHSVAYRVGSTPGSVSKQFFIDGNAAFGYDFSRYQDLYVFHFSPAATKQFLACRRNADRSYALDEWQMTLLRGLDGGGGAGGSTGGFNLLDGYACAPNIPPGSRVLVSMCMPDQVPWEFLADRTDLWRVAYTLESPNIRHSAQWDPVALRKHFDVVLTYWKPLLDDPRVNTLFCAHNTHHLDLGNALDLAQLRVNRGADKSCVMVLERRDLEGEYTVPNTDVKLKCLDSMREALVKDLRDVTVYGVGWDTAAARNPGVKLGHALHRSKDPRHAVDILQDYTFAIIVENCDAEGYASEKLYDALLAGAIPLYYGSVPPGVSIPEGHEKGVYLDLRTRGITTSDSLQTFLDSLTPGDVDAWSARVAELRLAVLAQVDTRSFAECVNAALAQKPV